MKKRWIPLFLLALMACSDEDYVPKPKAYFRIEFPEKQYLTFQSACPYTFQYPLQSILSKNREGKNCWYDLHYPQYQCSVHFTYNAIDKDNFEQYSTDAYNLVMKHIVRASYIDERRFENDSAKVFGVIYDLKGNTASNFQFYLTDSTNHFFRGSMYFHLAPNADSLDPVSEFIKQDLVRMIESFRWQ